MRNIVFHDKTKTFHLYNEKISYNNCEAEKMDIRDISKKQTNNDSSITNKSSISVIISYENKKLLFLADLFWKENS